MGGLAMLRDGMNSNAGCQRTNCYKGFNINGAPARLCKTAQAALYAARLRAFGKRYRTRLNKAGSPHSGHDRWRVNKVKERKIKVSASGQKQSFVYTKSTSLRKFYRLYLLWHSTLDCFRITVLHRYLFAIIFLHHSSLYEVSLQKELLF